MKKIYDFFKAKLNNAGSTMVEVLVGFTILVIIIVECMVHLVGVSSNMIEKSKDMDHDIRTLNARMYEKDADYQKLENVSFTLTVDRDKTNASNKALDVSINLDHANIYRFDCLEVDLTIFRVLYEE